MMIETNAPMWVHKHGTETYHLVRYVEALSSDGSPVFTTYCGRTWGEREAFYSVGADRYWEMSLAPCARCFPSTCEQGS